MSTRLEAEEDLLVRVAGSISDGAPVDWQDETSRGSVTEARLRPLRLVEEIVQAQRAVNSTSPAGGTTPVPTGEPSSHQRAGSGSADGGGDPLAAWGRLRNLRVLARGAFGEVFRAFDPLLEREVALKLPRMDRATDPAIARDFLQEARLLAKVRHANVLAVHGADRIDGQVGIWTDVIEGRTLEQCLAEQGPFSAREAALVGIDLCGALAAVHAAGLVHRDVKTTNVMRERGGKIVLMDFGTARGAADAGESPESGERAGTLITMAPEVLLLGQPARPEADLYGLGVILYRLVSGRYPIEADSRRSLLEQHRQGRRAPLRDVRPDLPPAFVQVVERALASDPAARYSSAGAMEQALASALAAERIEEAPRTPARLGWQAWAGIAAALLVLALTFWSLWPRPMEVEATFFRVNEGQRELLVSGQRVQPGDHLGLEILGSEPLYSYVINEDEKGEMWVLFPAGLDLANPLPPRSRVRLPGRQAGKPVDWVVTTSHGTETIVAILSREPLPELERVVASAPRVGTAGEPSYPPVPPGMVPELFRGIGGLAESTATATPASPGRLRDLVKRLPVDATVSRGLWVRQLELENPGP